MAENNSGLISEKQNSLNKSGSKVAWGGAGIIGDSNSKSYWNSSPNEISTPQSFKNIQSKDMMKALDEQQQRKSEKYIQEIYNEVPTYQKIEPETPPAVENEETMSDFEIARHLQYELNLEHDLELDREQRLRNKNSHVTLTNDHLKILPSCAIEALEFHPSEDRPIDFIEEEERMDPNFPDCGYVEVDGEIITKHNMKISSRNTTRKMMQKLPCEINMGDTAGFAIHMDNNVYSRLSNIVTKDAKRKQRKHDQAEKATLSSSLDGFSSKTLNSLRNNSWIGDSAGIISTGKEAIVLGATTGSMMDEIGVEVDIPCAVKVFKTRILEFKTREKYIRDDNRFKDRLSKTNAMTNLMLWTEKEYRNLHRARANGINCPIPYKMNQNIILMSFIGFSNTEPAPQLKNISLTPELWQDAYQQTVEIASNLLKKCHLVHADLSEYNLLYQDNTVFVIDFAQSVDIFHCNAISYLYRDLSVFANFFKKKGVRNVKTGLELLEEITGISIENFTDLPNSAKVDAAADTISKWRNCDCYSDAMFEFLWDQSQIRQEAIQNIKREFPEKEIMLDKCGDESMQEFITKKTDSAVIKSNSNKKKKRKNSKSQKNSEDLSSEFCLINHQDCSPDLAPDASPRVRFAPSSDDGWTSAAPPDTEDYGGDADTDDPQGGGLTVWASGEDTDAVYTDADPNYTDGGDTEGYTADADDTEGYMSDRIPPNSVHVRCIRKPKKTVENETKPPVEKKKKSKKNKTK